MGTPYLGDGAITGSCWLLLQLHPALVGTPGRSPSPDGLHLPRDQPPAAALQVLEERDFDGALRSIEDAADRVDETAAGSVQKKAKESAGAER